jgi:hypothetical protein
MNDALRGPGFREVAFDVRHHAKVCRCGVRLDQLDGGAPAVSVFQDDETREITCVEACAIEAVAERRHLLDEADGRDVLADAMARRSA